MDRTPATRRLAPSPLGGAACGLLALALLLAPLPARGSGFESADRCRECHRAIYDQWRGSRHATAFTHPDFRVPYDRVRREKPGLAAECEKCHDPMRSVLPPGSPGAASFANEGVTCDFCHSVESVASSGPYPRTYSLAPGVKFGPKGDYREKTVHVTRPSPLLKTAAFCAGCHEFRNAHGVPVLTTVSEWENSFYKGEGVHCQYCHLPELFDARFVEGDKGKRKGPADHAMMGGHSQERLARAIPVRADLVAVGDEAEVTVRLRNETVGHMVPSGMPHHRIRLRTTLLDGDGKPLGTKEEIFQRLLGDGAGKGLTSPDEFLDAREVISDNRLSPKEERVVRHRFPVGGGKEAAAAEVSLAYEIPTRDAGAEVRLFELSIAKSTVPMTGSGSLKTMAVVTAALVAALAAILWGALRGKKGGGAPK